MKKMIITFGALVMVLSLPALANANPENCRKASENSAWYQTKAAALWSAYGSCRGVEWMGGNVKKHCENTHHQAEKYQSKANYWHHQFVEHCVKD
jgi:hypothetical protein